MHKNIALIILILAVAFFISCSEEPAGPDTDILTGTWNWTKSYGGNLGYNDPEACQCSQLFVFSINNTYEHYYNGVVAETGTYEITDVRKVGDDDYEVMFKLDGNDAQAAIRGYELIMFPDPACLSCPDSIFYNNLLPI